MSSRRTNWLAAGLCLAGLYSTGLHAEQTYREIRSELLAEGWKPDASFGLKRASGAPLYRFPEIVCGPHLCMGKWRNGKGGEKAIRLLRPTGEDDFRLAP